MDDFTRVGRAIRERVRRRDPMLRLVARGPMDDALALEVASATKRGGLDIALAVSVSAEGALIVHAWADAEQLRFVQSVKRAARGHQVVTARGVLEAQDGASPVWLVSVLPREIRGGVLAQWPSRLLAPVAVVLVAVGAFAGGTSASGARSTPLAPVASSAGPTSMTDAGSAVQPSKPPPQAPPEPPRAAKPSPPRPQRVSPAAAREAVAHEWSPAAGCPGLPGLEAGAALGASSPADLACARDGLRSGNRGDRDKYSRVLIRNAQARGNKAELAAQLRRHLDEVDRSDADIAFAYAMTVPLDNTAELLRWTQVALDCPTRIEGEAYVTRRNELLKRRAVGLARGHARAERSLAAEWSEANLAAAEVVRSEARHAAREWIDYAEAATLPDLEDARALCASVTGTYTNCGEDI